MTEDIRTRRYVPSTFVASEGYEPEYTGYVEMKMIDYDLRSILQEKARDRLPKATMESVTAQVKDGGDEAAQAIAESNAGGALIRAMVSLLPDVIVAIDITRTDDGMKIESYDDMRYEGGLHNVMTELASVAMGKQRLTKPEPSATA